jgi:HEAT repeat protein
MGHHDAAEAEAALGRVDRLFGSRPAKQRKRGWVPSREAVRDLQLAALQHPDPHIRRSCLWVLDHYANDVSMPVFARAVEDDVDFVRDMALHSLACEGCKQQEMCVADVVPPLIRVLEHDPKPDLRIKALSALFGLSRRDDRAQDALERAARDNTDALVRRCAAGAANGVFTPPKKRGERSRRRNAALGHGTALGTR